MFYLEPNNSVLNTITGSTFSHILFFIKIRILIKNLLNEIFFSEFQKTQGRWIMYLLTWFNITELGYWRAFKHLSVDNMGQYQTDIGTLMTDLKSNIDSVNTDIFEYRYITWLLPVWLIQDAKGHPNCPKALRGTEKEKKKYKNKYIFLNLIN